MKQVSIIKSDKTETKPYKIVGLHSRVKLYSGTKKQCNERAKVKGYEVVK